MGGTEVEIYARELRALIASHHNITADRIALHVAEEAGECVGAHNKLSEGRGSLEHFMTEWAQATLMLSMLGQHYLPTVAARQEALAVEMVVQRRQWISEPGDLR